MDDQSPFARAERDLRAAAQALREPVVGDLTDVEQAAYLDTVRQMRDDIARVVAKVATLREFGPKSPAGWGEAAKRAMFELRARNSLDDEAGWREACDRMAAEWNAEVTAAR